MKQKIIGMIAGLCFSFLSLNAQDYWQENNYYAPYPQQYYPCSYCEQGWRGTDCCTSLLTNLYIVPHGSYAVGKTIGFDEGYGSGGLFAITGCNNIYVFGQGDAFKLCDSKWAATGGGGIRFVEPCSNSFVGINAFYDYRQGRAGNFKQLGFGFEAYACCWFLRGNFYFPFNHLKCRSTTFSFPGGFTSTCHFKEKAPSYANLEIERYFSDCFCFTPYLALGPYFLSFCDHNMNTGVRFRSGVTYRGWLYAEAIITHDSLYHTRVQGVFTVALPFSIFSCKILSSECNFPLWQRVNRFDFIPLDHCCDWTWNW